MPIQIFITGGTFDKEYNEITGKLYFKDTHLKEMLSLGRSQLDVQITTLMMIDSLDMTNDDRYIILESCKNCLLDKIIITHGTDTMIDTAKFLAKDNIDKTIVFTGAMIPIDFGSSDGLFNLGSAMGFVQSLESGIYIAMNGRCFNYDKVRKNTKTGIFESL
jgi:L-asparaginase|tara:strand:- start:251 stop:736 length:486 start_codon:yes stop_codon:yes gene_type:complete